MSDCGCSGGTPSPKRTSPPIPVPSAAAGWKDDGVNVRLIMSTDTVTIGGTASNIAGRKLTVVNTGTDLGVGVKLLAAADNVLDARVLAEANARVQLLPDALLFGPGGAVALDTRLWRTGVNELSVDNGAAGTAKLRVVGAVYAYIGAAANPVVQLDATGLGLGQGGGVAVNWFLAANATTSTRADIAVNRSLCAGGTGSFAVRSALADTNPTAALLSSTLKLGFDSADALSTRLYCTGSKALIFDDGGAGAIDLGVIGILTTQGRKVATAYGTATPYTVRDTDYHIGRDATLGNKVANLPAALDGVVYILTNTALFSVANTLTVNCNGGETINTSTGAVASVALTGAQSITLVGRTGVGWFPA